MRVSRRAGALVVGGLIVAVLAAMVSASGAAPTTPRLVQDVKTGSDKLGSLTPASPDPIQDYVQPDTQIEPSIATNPANPRTSSRPTRRDGSPTAVTRRTGSRRASTAAGRGSPASCRD
jgi:hypothetical protein